MSAKSRSDAAKKAHATRRASRIQTVKDRTAKWAVVMTRQRITSVTSRKGLRGRSWEVVAFLGPHGRESRGVVDLVAIRKDHVFEERDIKRGDFFEIVLIQ